MFLKIKQSALYFLECSMMPRIFERIGGGGNSEARYWLADYVNRSAGMGSEAIMYCLRFSQAK